ncbi:hypothetical protein LT493_11490 [Streptomyces tricolor]|nr:hypothetical protein [Streptomyces tricolor]
MVQLWPGPPKASGASPRLTPGLERSIARDFYAHPDVHEIGRRMDEIAGDLGTMG